MGRRSLGRMNTLQSLGLFGFGSHETRSSLAQNKEALRILSESLAAWLLGGKAEDANASIS